MTSNSAQTVSYYFHNSQDDVKETSNFRRALPQFLTVGVKNFVMFGYGMTLGFPTNVIPVLKNGESGFGYVTDEQISWFSSINLLCVPLGCLFSGIFTEMTGKRRAMQIIKVPMFASWLLFYFATDVYYLYAGLCLNGMSGGLMETTVLTYVAEVTEPRFRGMLTASGTMCVVIGILVQFSLASFMNWRTIALCCSFLPLLTIFALCFVPESPYWLLTKNRVNEARKSLAWLRGWVEPSQVDNEFQEIHHALVTKRVDVKHRTALSLFYRFAPYTKKPFLVPFVLVLATMFIGSFSGKTPLQTFANEIFQTLEAPIDEKHATILLGVAELVGAILCVVLVRVTGKRPLVFVSLIVSALCFSSTAFYAQYYNLASKSYGNKSILPLGSVQDSMNELNFEHLDINKSSDLYGKLQNEIVKNETFLQKNATGNLIKPMNLPEVNDLITIVEKAKVDTITSGKVRAHLRSSNKKPYAWVPLALLLTSALFIHIGIGLIPWTLIGEVYPTNVRSGASGLSSGAGYLFAFLSNKLFLSMLKTLTLPGTFLFYSSVSIVGCCVLYFTLPETEGRTLLEIEARFAGKKIQ